MSCGTETPGGRSGAPCELAAQRWSSATTPAVAPALTTPPTTAISTWTRSSTPLCAARRLISRPEALLSLDRDDLRARQRGPDREQAAVGTEVEHPPRARQREPSTQVHVPAVHLARPGGVGGGQRDHRPIRRPETGPGPRPDAVGGTSATGCSQHSGRWTANEVSQRAADAGRACRETDTMSPRARRAMLASPIRFPAAAGLGLERRHAQLEPGVIQAEAEPGHGRRGSRAGRCT